MTSLPGWDCLRDTALGRGLSSPSHSPLGLVPQDVPLSNQLSTGLCKSGPRRVVSPASPWADLPPP